MLSTQQTTPAAMMSVARARKERAKERQFMARATIERARSLADAIDFYDALLERLADGGSSTRSTG